MENIRLKSDQITGYHISLINDEEGLHVLHVTIHTGENSLLYCVRSDTRHPDLKSIHTFIENTLASASNMQSHALLDEYSERAYIYITSSDGTRNQYTAQRLYPPTA